MLIRSTLFTFGLLYCLIPFETEDIARSLVIRTCFALTFVAYTVYAVPGLLPLVPRRFFVALVSLMFAAGIGILASFSFRSLIFVSSTTFGAVVALAISKDGRYRQDFVRALLILLYLSVILVFVQLLWWLNKGEILTFHEAIFPMSTARVEDHISFARLGGMYVEPGTYANWVYALYLVYTVASKARVQLIGLLVGLSLIATGSVWGGGVGAALLVLYIVSLITERRYLAGLGLLAGAGALGWRFVQMDLYMYIQQKLLLESGSGASKLDALAEFDRMFWDILLMGKGFAPAFCVDCLSPQDAGVFVNLSVVMGVVFTSIFFCALLFFAAKARGLVLLLMMIPIGFAKILYWDFVLWLLFFVVLLATRESRLSMAGSLLVPTSPRIKGREPWGFRGELT